MDMDQQERPRNPSPPPTTPTSDYGTDDGPASPDELPFQSHSPVHIPLTRQILRRYQEESQNANVLDLRASAVASANAQMLQSMRDDTAPPPYANAGEDLSDVQIDRVNLSEIQQVVDDLSDFAAIENDDEAAKSGQEVEDVEEPLEIENQEISLFSNHQIEFPAEAGKTCNFFFNMQEEKSKKRKFLLVMANELKGYLACVVCDTQPSYGLVLYLCAPGQSHSENGTCGNCLLRVSQFQLVLIIRSN